MSGISALYSSGLILKNKKDSLTFLQAGIGSAHNIRSDSTGPKHFGSTKSISKSRGIRAMAAPNVSAPKREKDPKKRIVITGMGIVSVFGTDIDTFYEKLLQGKCGISVIDRFDISGDWPVKIAGQIREFSSEGYIDPKTDKRLDDCWRYCLVAGKKALEDANLSQQVLETMDRSRIGVLIRTAMGGVSAFANGVESQLLKGHKKITPFFIPYSLSNMGSALLAIETGLSGPNYSISTACSAATTSLFAAANHIRRGDADIMVAGGSEAGLTRPLMGGMYAAKAFTLRNEEPEKAVRPWCVDRDGIVAGEGCGVIVMESLESAVKRGAKIVGEYLGGAVNCDNYHITSPRPDGSGFAACFQKCLVDAGVSPEEVNYINPHATAKRGGDIAEIIGIKKAFKDTSELKINSTKSLIGHSFGACGGLEAIVTIKAINTGWLHPTLNQYNLEPEVTIDTVPHVKKKHEVNVAISNSVGFGSQNAAIVLAPFKP